MRQVIQKYVTFITMFDTIKQHDNIANCEFLFRSDDEKKTLERKQDPLSSSQNILLTNRIKF